MFLNGAVCRSETCHETKYGISQHRLKPHKNNEPTITKPCSTFRTRPAAPGGSSLDCSSPLLKFMSGSSFGIRVHDGEDALEIRPDRFPLCFPFV